MNGAFNVRHTPYPLQFLYYGTTFSSGYEVILSGSATIYLQGKTGSDRLVHFFPRTMTHNGTDVSVYLCEAPTFTADGTASATAYNMNRESAKTAQFTIYTNPPDATDDGLVLGLTRIFAATGGVGQATAAALVAAAGLERIMKKNTDYALKIVNNVTASTTFVVSWTWYESGN